MEDAGRCAPPYRLVESAWRDARKKSRDESRRTTTKRRIERGRTLRAAAAITEGGEHTRKRKAAATARKALKKDAGPNPAAVNLMSMVTLSHPLVSVPAVSAAPVSPILKIAGTSPAMNDTKLQNPLTTNALTGLAKKPAMPGVEPDGSGDTLQCSQRGLRQEDTHKNALQRIPQSSGSKKPPAEAGATIVVGNRFIRSPLRARRRCAPARRRMGRARQQLLSRCRR